MVIIIKLISIAIRVSEPNFTRAGRAAGPPELGTQYIYIYIYIYICMYT